MWKWLKNLLGIEIKTFSKKIEEFKKNHCDDHPKFKHRCPKCQETLNG